jgi:RNA polymerase sigma-B factor
LRRAEPSAHELAVRWRDHRDPAAREALVGRFLPLARKLAGRYANAHVPLEDLVQVASLGLVLAIDRFDPHRGVPFSGFAVPTVLGELKRYFRNTGWTAHVPRGRQELALRVDRATREITARRGHAPRVEELAEYLEVAPDDVLEGLEAGSAHYAISLDGRASSADDEEAETLSETIGRTDGGYALVDTASSLAAGIARLPYRERRALMLRLSGDMKQVEIGRELGCSQMQVSRLLRRAAARLREFAEIDSP